MQDDFGAGGGLENPAGDLEILVDDEGLAGAGLHGFERVLCADF